MQIKLYRWVYSSLLVPYVTLVPVDQALFQLTEHCSSWPSIVPVDRALFQLIEHCSSWLSIVQVDRALFQLTEHCSSWPSIVPADGALFQLTEHCSSWLSICWVNKLSIDSNFFTSVLIRNFIIFYHLFVTLTISGTQENIWAGIPSRGLRF